MLEDRQPRPEQEIAELNANLYRLVHTPLIEEQLKRENGTWLVGPRKLPLLNVAFVKKDSLNDPNLPALIGMNMCGKEDVIGVHIRRRNAVESGLRNIDADENLAELTNQGARVLVLTPADIRSWAGFYEQIYRSGKVAELGGRALEFSGLEWMSQKENERMMIGFEELLKINWNYFEQMGVVGMVQRDGADLVFVDKENVPLAVPIYHTRAVTMNGEVQVERVLERPLLCAGMVIQKPGEMDRVLRNRAAAIKENIQQQYSQAIEVVVIDEEQLSLWQKMGLSSEWAALDKESELSAERVVRFLYLGENNLEPGRLAKAPLSLSLPGRGDLFSFPGVDIVFSARGNHGSKTITTVDNLRVWDRRGQEISLSNVAGIRIFPRGSSFEDMKSYSDPIRQDFARRSGTPGAYILNLTPELFALWEKNGSPFFNGNIQMPRVDIRKQLEYFMPGKADRAFYFQIRQGPEIGGNKNGLMLLDNAGNRVSHLFDVGLGFSDVPKGYDGIGRDPNTADGLLRLLRSGVLPMVPGWWETEYLKQTVLKMTGMAYPSHIKGDVVAQYLVAELYGRSMNEELTGLPPAILRNIKEFGPYYKERWWGKGEVVVKTATPTHPHADHIGLFSYLDSNIEVMVSGPTGGFLKAITQKAGSWRRRLTDRKLITEEMVGRSYQTIPVSIEPYYFSGRRMRLSSQVTMEPFFVTHSVPSVWQVYDFVNKNGGSTTLFNSGDWNVDRDRRVFEIAGRIAGRPDVIVMEGTNIGTEKAYVGKTEVDVRDTFMEVVRAANKELVVAVAPINNLTRLRSIMEVAEATGRKLALSFPHAELAMQLAAAKKMAPMDAEGFEDVLPYDIGNDRLTVWAKQMTAPRAFHKALMEIAERGNLGVLNHERLSRENGKWIVVVSPFDVLEDQFDGLHIEQGMRVVWMSSFPFEQQQKYFVGANNEWMRRNGRIRFIADMEVSGQGGRIKSVLSGSGVLHVSGHASAEEMIAVTDMLVGRDRKNIPIIINHTESPEEMARLLRTRLGDRVVPISRMDRYDPTDPLNKRGFYFPLF